MWIENLFYDKTCTIWRTSYVIVDWSEIMSHNVVYSDIPCSFWEERSAWFRDWTYAREQWYEDLNVDLQPTYTNIRKWYNIDLSDSIWSIWNYVVNNVHIYKKPNWIIDNISLKVITRPDQWS